jgi:hypothetical protein
MRGKTLLIFGGLGTAVMALLYSRTSRAASSWPDFHPEEPTTPLEPKSYISTSERDERFGPLVWTHSPSVTNPERVVVVNSFASDNLVRRTYPELPGNPTIDIHRDAAEPLARVLEDLEERGMLGLIRSYDGVYNPRLVRGSTTNLSSHAYGTSIDLNARENPLGSPPTSDQRRLAEVFEQHGWYWGDRFSRRDPMHFEWLG